MFPVKSFTVEFDSNFENPSKIFYPSGIEELKFIYNESKQTPTEPIVFPKTVKVLEFYGNYPLSLLVFPEDLQKLSLGNQFNQDIRNANFPQGLTHLTLGWDFNQDVRNANLPQSLTHLTFLHNFNQDIRNANFPQGLTHLSLGYSFNLPIEGANLPQGLIHLSFGCKFNQKLDDLPSSVKNVKLPKHFQSRYTILKT